MATKNLFILSTLFVVMLADVASAQNNITPPRPTPVCSAVVNHRVVFSGRDEDIAPDIQKYADLLFNPGGVVDQLGLARPPQIIQFMTGRDINSVSANGRMPVGHWHEGGMVVKGDSAGGTLLEMVIHGGHLRHSVYRDDLPLRQQFSIINHVVGHVHFGATTMWNSRENADLHQTAYEYDAYLEELKKKYNRTEIAEWYQHLLTLRYAQDIILADNERPADFTYDPNRVESTDGSMARTKAHHPRHATANILQAFVANLPHNLPTWKLEMAKRFERLNAYIPGAVRTKIMNEGFATLMQELLPAHTRYNTFDHAMDYCCLMEGVARPKITNPYWLGLEAWRNIRSRFNARPEVRDLSLMARDRAFIAFATKEIIGKMDDAQFLRAGLDASWIARKNFAVTRFAKPNEIDHSMQPPQVDPDETPPAQHIIISRDPGKVITAIIQQVFHIRQMQFPRPVLTDLAADGTGIVQLEISDVVGRRIPLDHDSIVDTLYIMAQLMKKPVSLESSFVDDSTPNPAEAEEDVVITPNDLDEMLNYRPKPQPIKLKRTRVTVWPNGNVAAHDIRRDGSGDPEKIQLDPFLAAVKKGVKIEEIDNPRIAAALKTELDLFKLDLSLGRENFKDVLPKSIMSVLETSVANAVNGVSPQLMLAVPTVPHALEAYAYEVNSRSFNALQLAIMGRRDITHGLSGVRLQVLPDLPYFEFDQEVLAKILAYMPAPNPDQMRTTNLAQISPTSADFPLNVNPVTGEPGKRFWGPGQKKPCKSCSKPGSKSKDPRFVDLSLEDYATALGVHVQLPNLRPKDGGADEQDETRDDWSQRISGPPKASLIARKAFERGLAHYRTLGFGLVGTMGPANEDDDSKGEVQKTKKNGAKAKANAADKPRTVGIEEIYKKGFALLDMQRDWFVESHNPEPTPVTRAHVTFIIDLSGSYEDYVESTKQMFFDLRALLKKGYAEVEFSFVAFDGSAHAVEDPEEFFNLELGGGTSYAKGLEKTLEVQEKYPEAQYDRFVVLAGDMEDFDHASSGLPQLFDRVRKNSQFFASVRMASSSDPANTTIDTILRDLSASDPYVSYVDLAPDNEYEPLVLRRVFKNDTNTSR